MYFHLKRAESLFTKYTCTGLFYILLQSTADELLFKHNVVWECFHRPAFFFFNKGDVLTF